MKERKYYEERYKNLKENEMFTDKDKVFMETSPNSSIESPNFEILIKRREKEPFISKDEHTLKMHQKLVQKFSMHHYDPIISGNIDSSDFEIHDKAVNRALNSNYDPYKDKNIGNSYANNTIFVSKLPDIIKNSELEEFFSKYGEIEKITIPKNIISGINKGYAFIEFKHLEDAINAYDNSHKTNLFGREILVDFVRGKNTDGWVPRRFGGGLGGDIKSGQQRFGGRDLPHKSDKRDRYYEEDEDYDDHRHKRYREYDRKSKRSDREYYDRREYKSYHDYDKKYYVDPYSNLRYDDYDRYDRYSSRGSYYDSFEDRYEREDRRYDDLRYQEKRYYERRYDDLRHYDERYDDRRFEERRYHDDRYDDKLYRYHDDRKPSSYLDKRGDYLSKSHYDDDYNSSNSSSSKIDNFYPSEHYSTKDYNHDDSISSNSNPISTNNSTLIENDQYFQDQK